MSEPCFRFPPRPVSNSPRTTQIGAGTAVPPGQFPSHYSGYTRP